MALFAKRNSFLLLLNILAYFSSRSGAIVNVLDVPLTLYWSCLDYVFL